MKNMMMMMMTGYGRRGNAVIAHRSIYCVTHASDRSISTTSTTSTSSSSSGGGGGGAREVRSHTGGHYRGWTG